MGDETTIYLEGLSPDGSSWMCGGKFKSYGDIPRKGVRVSPGVPGYGSYSWRWRIGRKTFGATIWRGGYVRPAAEVREAWEAAREAALYRARVPFAADWGDHTNAITNDGSSVVHLGDCEGLDGLQVEPGGTLSADRVDLSGVEMWSVSPIEVAACSYRGGRLRVETLVGPGKRRVDADSDVDHARQANDQWRWSKAPDDVEWWIRNAIYDLPSEEKAKMREAWEAAEAKRQADCREAVRAAEAAHRQMHGDAIDIRAQLVDGIGSDVLERCAGEWVGTGIGWALRLHESSDTHWLASVIDCGDPRDLCGQISLCDCGESALLYESVVGPAPDCRPGSEALSVAQQLRPRIEAVLDMVATLRGLGEC